MKIKITILIILILILILIINLLIKINYNKSEKFENDTFKHMQLINDSKTSETSNTTFISGYWKIKDNVKHSYDNHYKKLIPKTLTILKNCNIVFFYDNDDVLSDIK